MKNKYTILIVLFISSVLAAKAQDLDGKNMLTVDLHLLTQGEIRRGGLPASDQSYADWSNFVLGRTRINVGYQSPHISGKATIQNSAIWGQAGNTAVILYEGWGKLRSNNGLFLQAGRQVLAYDDERILGANDWAMAGITHDALRLGYDGPVHKAHLILAYNQNAENRDQGGSFYADGALPYKSMQTAWYHCELEKIHLSLSLLGMNVGMQSGKQGVNEHIEWQQVVGGFLKFNLDPFSLEGSAYKQMGHAENGLLIDAWMASVKALLKPAKNYGFRAGYDYLSGDPYFAVPAHGAIGVIRHEVIRGFSSIFGSHHEFYGAMDFFYVSTYLSGFTPGLQNAYVGATVKGGERCFVDLSYHYLAMASHLPDLAMTLGHEFELEASYRILPDAALSLGFSYMTGTETMQRLKRVSSDSNLCWTWVSLLLTPRIVTHRW